MGRGLFLLLSLLGTILAGCSKTEQPKPENLPDIPPGRAQAKSDGSASQDCTNPSFLPADPRQRGLGR